LTAKHTPDYCPASDNGCDAGSKSLSIGFSPEGRELISNSHGRRILHVLQRFGKIGGWGVTLGITFLGVSLSASAQAATFTVDSPSDVRDANPGNGICETAPGNGVCTLRAAIQEANALPGADEIILPPNTYLLTLVAELAITGDLTIMGSRAAASIIDGNKILRPDSGVLRVNAGVTVSINGVTISNGRRVTNNGGGIYNSGALTLTNSIVSGNSVGSFGGGGIFSDNGTLIVSKTTVSGNSAASFGGGIFSVSAGLSTLANSTVSSNSSGSHGGGIFFDRGRLTLVHSTVSDNTAGGDGGGIENAGTLMLLHSTVTANSSNSYGGGIFNFNFGTVTLSNSTVSNNSATSGGGGIYNHLGTLTLTNSTVSGNSSRLDGGGIYNEYTVNSYNSTIIDNRADADLNGLGVGGGVFNDSSAIFNFQNTILAGNFESGLLFKVFISIPADCAGTINSNSNNIIADPNCTINGPFLQTNPMLGPLQDNGGPTQTHALLPGSPAIDAGNPGGCRDNLGALLTTDQRGFPRPVDGNNDNVLRCDIGAYELFTGSTTGVVAALLPSSRSVRVGTPATVFATMINTGQGVAAACSIAPLTNVPATFQYQTTDPATNQVTGFPNTTASIAAGAAQSFVFAVTPTAPIAPTDVQLSFDCANTDPAPVNVGLNTLLLSASATPVPDIVALAATPPPDPGIVNIPGTNGTGAFAVATVNVGASGNITASADTGAAILPVNVSLCETNPATGQCVSSIGPSVTTTINAGTTPTFGIFVQASGNVPFDPAANRIFVRFKDGGGVTRGSTSVAVRTQ
jgi:CSLREA domain-containing protein